MSVENCCTIIHILANFSCHSFGMSSFRAKYISVCIVLPLSLIYPITHLNYHSNPLGLLAFHVNCVCVCVWDELLPPDQRKLIAISKSTIIILIWFEVVNVLFYVDYTMKVVCVHVFFSLPLPPIIADVVAVVVIVVVVFDVVLLFSFTFFVLCPMP